MWKKIEKYPCYEINEHGVIRNTETHYVTTQRMNKQGYLYVQLHYDNKNHCCLVHRLVAETFIPNPEELPIVNHIDECCVHNAADNLEWVSYKENSNHGTRNERIVRERKIQVIAFNEDGKTVYRFASRYDASRELGVSENSIRTAMKNRNRCKKLFWRASSLSPADDEFDKNLEWLEETKRIKAIQNKKDRIVGKKPVCAINEFNDVVYSYPSIVEAAKDMHVSSPAIAHAITGKTKCRGFRWVEQIEMRTI